MQGQRPYVCERKMGTQDFELGYFHQWGVNYEELRDGVGSYTVAIVELPDGRVIMPVADEIIFLSEGGNI